MKIFQGRTNRRDYAIAVLAVILITAVISTPLAMTLPKEMFQQIVLGVQIVAILALLPVTVRRMQDVGHSGVWVLMAQIASVFGYFVWSALISVLLLFWAGKKDESEYGAVPASVGGFIKPLYKAGSLPSVKEKK
jgi:uncharacterized membrane protein YhaH (DUF805 family)